MKTFKLRNIKIIILTLVILIISVICNNTYAYQLKIKVMPKDELKNLDGRSDFPEAVFRKQTAAHPDTIKAFNNATKSALGWVYNKPVQVTFSNDWNKFHTWREYFHPYQNSNYTTEPAQGYTKRYYLTGTTSVSTNPKITASGKASFWNIWGESGNYQGIYTAPADITNYGNLSTTRDELTNPNIVVLNYDTKNNANNVTEYRYAIVNGDTAVSDNIFKEETKNEIMSKYSNNAKNKVVTVYSSAITKTNKSNGKYWCYMDTAFKFWETTKKGNHAAAWNQSPTTVGTDPEDSFVNYYDNTYEFPVGCDKNIYVRHIDITGLDTITPDIINNKVMSQIKHGQVLEVSDWKYDEANQINKPILSKMIKSNEKQKVDGYNDYYSFAQYAMPRSFIIGNAKYTNEYYKGGNSDEKIAVSYLSTIDADEQEILDKYYCVGYNIGKGSSLEEAKKNRDKTLEQKYSTRNNFSQNDYTNVVVGSSEKDDYIVIDFFYEKPAEKSKVYVRHIDLTNYEGDINKTNVDKAIQNKEVLAGRGVAYNESNTPITKTGSNEEYQEIYETNPGGKLKVYGVVKENSVLYECIGTNLVSSLVNLDSARNLLNTILSRTYTLASGYFELDPSGDMSAYRVADTNNNYIIIDFYYKRIDDVKTIPGGKTIERTKIGRLSYYTDNSNFDNVNTTVSDNSKVVYDIIPSGEKLTMSIDNAYKYMLGGISIQENEEKNGTIKLNYTIVQDFNVYCNTYNYICRKCEKIIKDFKYKGESECPIEECGGALDKVKANVKKIGFNEIIKNAIRKNNVNYCFDESDNGTRVYFEIVSQFEIPYTTMYYTVKNMRIYTISKIELQDGYSNAGLPLFDGKTHIINTSQAYKDIFINSVFKSANFEYKLNRDKIELTPLKIYYNNSENIRVNKEKNKEIILDKEKTKKEIGKMLEAIAETFPSSKITNLNKSDIAQLKGFVVNTDLITIEEKEQSEVQTTITTMEPLTLTMTLTNDQIVLGDGTVIVGNKKVKENRLNNIDGIISETRTEEATTIKLDLSKYNENDVIKLNTVYPKSIRANSIASNGDVNWNAFDATGSQYLPSTSLTTKDDFENTFLTIPVSSLNGKRYSYGKIYYNLLSDNANLNFDTVNGERVAVSGGNGKNFYDTEMYRPKNSVVGITKNNLGSITWEYGKDNKTVNSSSSRDADVVDVFTPIQFTTSLVQSGTENDKFVNHTSLENDNQLQKNARFKIQMNSQNYKMATFASGKHLSTTKYLKEYYIKFDFDVQDIVIYDNKSASGRKYDVGVVSAGTWIGPIYNNSAGEVNITAFALEDQYLANALVYQEKNAYTVRAVAYNTPDSITYDLIKDRLNVKFVTQNYNVFSGITSNNQSHQLYYTQDNIYGHSNYVAEKTVETQNLDRIYDFKVTDCKDIDWKNIFRTTSATMTNTHTSKAYYSGIYKWNIYTTKASEMLVRDVSEIGTTKQQTLPLGPYKHTNTTYIKAPKLGYKFSFDFKTTGANANKKVVITPSFYYVKKDGTGYTTDIKLFYKNSRNKYVPIENYNLYFVPDDGYRLTFKGTDEAYRFDINSALPKSTVKLGTTNKLTLNSKMMETADKQFVQIWYGEYKLPNSTIAVKVENNEYDINKKLTDGYIGVKFDIVVYEYNSANMTEENITKILKYSQDDKNSGTNSANTSQWDYEGYLGFDKANVGTEVADPTKTKSENTASGRKQYISIPLENGTWKLNNKTYNEIKGTVILYDIDAKASSDYD